MLKPGSTIGILGGGQLGRMTAAAAARLGYRCHVYAPAGDNPAFDVAAEHTIAGYDDGAALDAFAAAVDVVTLEFENVPVAALDILAGRVPVRPNAAVLAVTQDRMREKVFAAANGIETAPWAAIVTQGDFGPARAKVPGAAILKTARLGYDGKGQVILSDGEPLDAAFARLGGVPCILEGMVRFRREVSVIVARREDGNGAAYPPVENRHEDGILRQTLAPAPLDPEAAGEAEAVARRLADALDLVGLLAVEMFEDGAGRFLMNEMAPRPHNSGHWSLDAAPTSQFEQLVRAVCGLPLGSTTPIRPARMTNLLGDEAEAWAEILAEPGARLYLYGKGEAKAGRKMGHVTRVG